MNFYIPADKCVNRAFVYTHALYTRSYQDRLPLRRDGWEWIFNIPIVGEKWANFFTYLPLLDIS